MLLPYIQNLVVVSFLVEKGLAYSPTFIQIGTKLPKLEY